MDDECTVTFEGDQGGTYYVACNLVEYISTDGMVNTGSSTINLYTGPQSGTNTNYIQISAFSYPRYGTGQSVRYITNAHNVTFNNRAYYYRNFDVVEICLMCFMASCVLIRTIFRGGR